MKSKLENLNKLERETFESFGQKGYDRTIHELIVSLDEFTEAEATAILESAKTSIALRKIWRMNRNQLVKQDRGEQIS